MTIRASFGVVREIGITLGVDKGKSAEPYQQAQRDAEQQGIAKRGVHSSRSLTSASLR